MYLTSFAAPHRCPLINESPHHAPNSCTPPGRGNTGRYVTGRSTPAGSTASFPPQLVASRSAAAVVAVSAYNLSSSGPGGSLKNEFAFTLRESRYHGGRKRRMFAVPRVGERN